MLYNGNVIFYNETTSYISMVCRKYFDQSKILTISYLKTISLILMIPTPYSRFQSNFLNSLEAIIILYASLSDLVCPFQTCHRSSCLLYPILVKSIKCAFCRCILLEQALLTLHKKYCELCCVYKLSKVTTRGLHIVFISK